MSNLLSLCELIKQMREPSLSGVDANPLFADNEKTTHPLQGHLVGGCSGRKNRLLGGFFISRGCFPA